MKRCNNCFRYALGKPTYCTYCGRSYDKRICSRGHLLSRYAQFCPSCGSNDLSTPAPPEAALAWLSRWSLQILVGGFVALVLFSLAATAFVYIDWAVLIDPMLRLALMLGLLYWVTTLLPGPVKRIGRAAGRQAMKLVRNRRNGGSRRSH
jgi:hypothetical protein